MSIFRASFFCLFFINSVLFSKLATLNVSSDFQESVLTALDDSNYVLCIDGGGSKTELQVLDSNGYLVELEHCGKSTYSVRSGGSNINVVGLSGIKQALDTLFAGVKTKKDQIDLLTLVKQCTVIAGFSGADIHEVRDKIFNLFKEYGFTENKIIVTSDSVMSLEPICGDGIILIAGTGSVCLGKKGADTIRVGGLGRLLGDEGSGYYIGHQALKFALEDEFGWGRPTKLKFLLRDFFKTSDLKTMVIPFYNGEINNCQIAAITPIVFDLAEKKDEVALEIVDNALNELSKLLVSMIRLGSYKNSTIYFFGGIFKSKNADLLIKQILQKAEINKNNWSVFNKSSDNPAVLLVQQVLVK